MQTSDLFRELLARITKEEQRLVSVRAVEAEWNARRDFSDARTLELLALWLKAQGERIGAKGFVFGASGGVDSSLAAVLLARAAPKTTTAFVMPCGGPEEDEADALALLQALGLPVRRVDLAPAAIAFLAAMGLTQSDISREAWGNLATRLRCSALYLEANRAGAVVVGTGDLDEAFIGYATKGTAADLHPLNGLHKHEVRALLALGLAPFDAALAQRLSTRVASPGFWAGQTAEAELGMEFPVLSAAVGLMREQFHFGAAGLFPRHPSVLEAELEKGPVSAAQLLQVVDLVAKNLHKISGSPSLARPEGC